MFIFNHHRDRIVRHIEETATFGQLVCNAAEIPLLNL